MGVDNLPKKDQQPFYNVLVSDNSIRYAAQESLEFIGTMVDVTHPLVGKYFLRRQGCEYIPVPAMADKYPQDEEKRKQHVDNLG